MVKDDFVLNKLNGTQFFTSRALGKLGFTRHFFSTRTGGVSLESYESLNLGIYTEDMPKNIKSNFEIIFKAAGMNTEKMVYLKQVHGNAFHLVNEENYNNITGSDGDAVITASRGIAIGVLTADCVPIIVADSDKKVVSVIHAGWKGTCSKIAENVVKYLINEFNSNPKDIVAVIGPSIGPCCFEVKGDVADRFEFVKNNNGKLFVDLWRENEAQFLSLGIDKKNIIVSELCTACQKDLFYSYRKEGGRTGRMGTFIEII